MAANYPFATIEPNVGVVPVPDGRLDSLADVVEKNDKVRPPVVPATVEFVDIAGIVAGAHKGEGLGNKFLSHIREVDLIAHMVRDFEDGDVVRTGEGLESDYETITSELILKDLETIQAQKFKSPNAQRQNPKLAAVLEKLEVGFNEAKRAIEILSDEELEEVKELFLLTNKAQIVVVNVGEGELKVEGEKVKSVAERLKLDPEDIVVVSAKIESELAVLDDDDAKMFMDDLGVKESGLERAIKVAYGKLGLISFLTAGVKEVRAWTLPAGWPAVRASGVIHTDFENKFIKAEVVAFEDFVANGGWRECRELGKVRLEGRDYVMRDGDVVDFKIGA